MKNSTFMDIAQQLYNADTVLLYPHVGIDGDAVGSCASLIRVLRKLGKKAYALYADEMPANLEFMCHGDDGVSYFTDDAEIVMDTELDVSMCVDCGNYDRFKDFSEKFDQAEVTICVDHHPSNESIAEFNYIDPEAAACGELIYELLKELNSLALAHGCEAVLPDKAIGEMIFAAITTDTGNFQYSNTRRRSHEIMAELYDWGIDTNSVSVEIYENERPEKIMIMNKAMENLQVFGKGKGAIAFVTHDDLESIGVKAGETDPIVQKLRSIAGVEFAAFIKEKSPNEIRVSYRAKTNGNVAELAKRHDGGGHVKAAGCTLYMTIQEAVEIIRKDMLEAIAKL